MFFIFSGGHEAPTKEKGGTGSAETVEHTEEGENLEESEMAETSELQDSSRNMDQGLSVHKDKEVQDDDAAENEEIGAGDSSMEVEMTHTEVDLTEDLETQRLTGMCRVCAKSKVKLFPVFGTGKNIMEKIHSFLPILVRPYSCASYFKLCGWDIEL